MYKSITINTKELRQMVDDHGRASFSPPGSAMVVTFLISDKISTKYRVYASLPHDPSKKPIIIALDTQFRTLRSDKSRYYALYDGVLYTFKQSNINVLDDYPDHITIKMRVAFMKHQEVIDIMSRVITDDEMVLGDIVYKWWYQI